MAELRAVQRAFPLYGSVELQNGQAYSHALLENHGALVRPELLTALEVSGRRPDCDRHGDRSPFAA